VLPAENRLRRRREFSTAVRRGRRSGRSLLVAHLYLPSRGGGGAAPLPTGEADARSGPAAPGRPRAGVVVGRTVGPAVVRNRVRRRLRHVLRDRIAVLPAGTLLVVRALPGAAAASSADLAADLDRALARVLAEEGAS
jgi:ribonuclease P protein component